LNESRIACSLQELAGDAECDRGGAAHEAGDLAPELNSASTA
jgi:hypothetical protein